jgi:choline dehydrogenase-like flavoprotein
MERRVTDMTTTLTPQELRLRTLLRILALLFGLAIFAYLLPALGVFGTTMQAFYIEAPFVTNSVVKIGTLALLSLIAAADVRRFRILTLLVILGHVISELAMICVLLWGDTGRIVTLGAPVGTRPVGDLLWFAIVMDGVILVLLGWFYASADRARYSLRYFSPTEFRSLTAIAEVVVTGEDEVVTAEEVARNTDAYLGGFRASSKWLAKLVLTGMQLYPLFSLHAPLSYMAAEDRLEFIRKRFRQDVTLRLMPGFLRMLVQAMIRMSKQLAYLGYYGDARTFASVGYVPFSARPDREARQPEGTGRPRPMLDVQRHTEVYGETIEADVVIIGSGAAGSIIAHRILAETDRSVLMLERGMHVDPSSFSEDEVEQLSLLYSDGALQLSRDFRLQVLQGSCVGGTTVVNNAVCFRIPPNVLDRWNDDLQTGLDPSGLMHSFAAVESMIDVHQQHEARLNPGAGVFTRGVHALGYDRAPNRYEIVTANIRDCLGCGYCNIGCAYGRKLSMLDVVLPDAQRTAGDRFRILSGCEALDLRGRSRRITSVRCRLANGRRVEVKGRTFVVAAGAISSSLLLLRSGVGGKNVGRRVSFNIGSPVTALFPQKLDSYDGLQISHYLEMTPGRGYVIETWYNPPVAQALTMPGWFEDHYRNMRRYDRMSAAGVLVGSEPNATVRRAGLTGREIDFEPTAGDLAKVLDGVKLAGEVFFAGGAEAVMPATFEYIEYRSAADLDRLVHEVRDASDITLGTGHPMGGNAIGGNESNSVIDPEFRVRGYDNIFVCDASIFPTALGVNPQLTVMGLAHYAAPFIAAGR